MSDLDKLLGDFDTRKEAEKDSREAKATKDKQLRDESLAILESIVLPTLKELSEAIVAKDTTRKCKSDLGRTFILVLVSPFVRGHLIERRTFLSQA